MNDQAIMKTYQDYMAGLNEVLAKAYEMENIHCEDEDYQLFVANSVTEVLIFLQIQMDKGLIDFESRKISE